MILYVNGDSHSAAAEAVNDYCFAEDDRAYYALGRLPHPDNERVSYGCNIANELYAILHCDAESASSNARIMRTTRTYIRDEGKPDAMIIGWSTWEREEWFHDGVWWQVNGGGISNDWPQEIKERYKDYITGMNFTLIERKAHTEIYEFHKELKDQEIPHLFFNCHNYFRNNERYDWGNNYLSPYDSSMTYWQWLVDNGCTPKPSNHFAADAHRKWADFLLPHLTTLL